MAQDKTAPPSTYTQLDDGDPDEDVIWSSKRAVLIESWSEMWWRENVTLPLRNRGLVPYAGPTTYKLTKNELIITFRSWDRYTQCLLPKKAVLETSRHIDLDHIISVSTTATARPYVTYETVTIEMDMMKTSRPVENIYVNPGESQAVVAKIMALTRENAVFDKQKPYKRPLPTLPPGLPPRPVPK